MQFFWVIIGAKLLIINFSVSSFPSLVIIAASSINDSNNQVFLPMDSQDNDMQNHVFGPVPSRRLGRSLGVDLVPLKFCSYDCIYCQIGRTTNKTSSRQSWASIEEIVEQIRGKLHLKPDFITLSGSGEPTLYTRIGELIGRIKAMTDIPVAVITNGSLLSLDEVRDALKQADLVVPSLDAGCDETFQAVNRPCKEISFQEMLDGLIKFRREFSGQYWLEVFILAGVNDSEAEIKKLADCVKLINPDKVQVNTVSRPPAETFAKAIDKENLRIIAKSLSYNAEVIADFNHDHTQSDFTARVENVLEMLKRRPCSNEDIAAGLGIHLNEVVKYVEELLSQGKITPEQQGQSIYYKAII